MISVQHFPKQVNEFNLRACDLGWTPQINLQACDLGWIPQETNNIAFIQGG